MTVVIAQPRKIAKLTASVNDIIVNRAVRHSIYLEQLKTSTVREMVGLLNDDVLPSLIADLERRLRNIASRGFDVNKAATLRLRQLLASTEAIIRNGTAQVQSELRGKLQDIAKHEADFYAALMTDATKAFQLDFVTPSPTLLNSIITSRPFQGKILRDWFADLTVGVQTRLEQAVSIGLTRGESVPQLVSRVGPLADLTRNNVESIVRTATTHVTAQAREMTYEANDDIVKGVQFVATLDARTTPICRALDGKVFEMGAGPRPPMHFNCRSTTVPVLKSFDELGLKGMKDVPLRTRASMNGQVSASLDYNAWLEKQPRATVEEILGPRRAALFIDEGIPVTRFVDNKYQPLTLAQIKKREGL